MDKKILEENLERCTVHNIFREIENMKQWAALRDGKSRGPVLDVIDRILKVLKLLYPQYLSDLRREEDEDERD